MERLIVETLEDLGFYFIYSEGDDLFYFEWEDRSRLTDRDLKDIDYALSEGFQSRGKHLCGRNIFSRLKKK